MKHFLTLLSHEIRMLLVSPATYIAATLFLSFMGLIFIKILEEYSGTPQEASPADVYFQLFWLPVCVMVPLLTMKCLAEERRFLLHPEEVLRRRALSRFRPAPRRIRVHCRVGVVLRRNRRIREFPDEQPIGRRDTRLRHARDADPRRQRALRFRLA